ncbi:hypothetical protein JQ604_24180 [Bradyrhizobium jicamae]|uniref:YciI family protein n=1 Tax=Bradyrhizobium jicamae TaxID=280332 RepID=UPI001BA4DEF3|nr:YciI family protein [Bradyrhizobium jicamae]MBR0755294.1 hypothetical protein [Bradyrhizobium jicamae]
MAEDDQSAKELVADLKSRMWKQSFYVMIRRIIAPSKLEPVVLAHYRWIIDLEKSGLVALSGPVFTKDEQQGAGMTVFRVDSWHEAEELAVGDPFVASGAVEFDLMRWQINEGRFSVQIDFSDQTFQAR